ncbi:VOC family protein [Poseidonocella sedimentorum]|uniref:Catechol 2,3-dioxygenase n=1 Tax=Poseidonocella sedimentorum TaxID=871652 RepID=A0A1I6DXL9_9RHOB|nr:VOC family protein [Poseidonocella sedimentorum]SFR10264.1 Catechol 2,3-dioxygenase [Poseidonocella sedimentorum]
MTRSLACVALVVRDYDEAIAWFRDKLDFILLEDVAQPEQAKRWVTMSPGTGEEGSALLLARAATPEQARFIGDQAGGRVFLFLRTDDFARDHARFQGRGVRFVRPPLEAPYGKVAVFEDLYGNRWDLVEFTDGRA